MGIYINPSTAKTPHDKEHIIAAAGVEVDRSTFLIHSPGANSTYGVCVVDNGPFNAAGVAYSKAEAQVFAAPDSSSRQRPRRYFLLEMDKIKELDPSAAAALENISRVTA